MRAQRDPARAWPAPDHAVIKFGPIAATSRSSTAKWTTSGPLLAADEHRMITDVAKLPHPRDSGCLQAFPGPNL